MHLIKIAKVPRKHRLYKIVDSDNPSLISKPLKITPNGLLNFSHYYIINTAGILFDADTGEPAGFFETVDEEIII